MLPTPLTRNKTMGPHLFKTRRARFARDAPTQGREAMQRSIPQFGTTLDSLGNRRLPWLVVGAALLFFAAPWGVEHKAHALMHGLCAQTPSHTLRFGTHGLPFDSRMTGIYGGFIGSFA